MVALRPTAASGSAGSITPCNGAVQREQGCGQEGSPWPGDGSGSGTGLALLARGPYPTAENGSCPGSWEQAISIINVHTGSILSTENGEMTRVFQRGFLWACLPQRLLADTLLCAAKSPHGMTDREPQPGAGKNWLQSAFRTAKLCVRHPWCLKVWWEWFLNRFLTSEKSWRRGSGCLKSAKGQM